MSSGHHSSKSMKAKDDDDWTDLYAVIEGRNQLAERQKSSESSSRSSSKSSSRTSGKSPPRSSSSSPAPPLDSHKRNASRSPQCQPKGLLGSFLDHNLHTRGRTTGSHSICSAPVQHRKSGKDPGISVCESSLASHKTSHSKCRSTGTRSRSSSRLDGTKHSDSQSSRFLPPRTRSSAEVKASSKYSKSKSLSHIKVSSSSKGLTCQDSPSSVTATLDSLIVPETVSPNQGDLEAKLEEIRKEQERLTRRSRDLKKQISQQRELFKSESKRRLARDGSFRRMSAY